MKARKLFILKNKQGFTLAECLFALFIFLTLQLTLLQLQTVQFHYFDVLSQYYGTDWDYFVNGLSHDIAQAKVIKFQRQTLYLKNQAGDEVTYSFYMNESSRMLRRQVDGKGHQPMLLHVQSVTLRDEEGLDVMEVKMINDETYHYYFYE